MKYLNRDVNIKNHTLGKPKIKAPQDSFANMVIKANSNGEFTFTIPKEGYWGFRAAEVGSVKEYKGKKLEQDAIIWVETKNMK